MTWADRHQVALYLGAIGLGAVVGLGVPDAAEAFEAAVLPTLAVLLFLTFLGVPFAGLGAAVRDIRFLTVVLVVNFVAVPAVVFLLSRFVADDRALLVGVLLVLLTPCVDYVIVFAGLAGGARDRLLAATPLLMVLQIVLLPGYLWLMAGPDVVAAIDPRPFADAFLLLVAVPLVVAALVQLLARGRGRDIPVIARVTRRSADAMVPVMMLTLALVVASQIAAVGGEVSQLAPVIPVFVVFAAVSAVGGGLVARWARLDVGARRAVVFSAVTRNSLVVLPLALALPTSFAIAPLVVVTQTLVELVVMVVMVAVVPRIVVDPAARVSG